MQKFLPLFAAFLLAANVIPVVHDAHGVTDEEKKSAFLESRNQSKAKQDARPKKSPSVKKTSAKPLKSPAKAPTPKAATPKVPVKAAAKPSPKAEFFAAAEADPKASLRPGSAAKPAKKVGGEKAKAAPKKKRATVRTKPIAKPKPAAKRRSAVKKSADSALPVRLAPPEPTPLREIPPVSRASKPSPTPVPSSKPKPKPEVTPRAPLGSKSSERTQEPLVVQKFGAPEGGEILPPMQQEPPRRWSWWPFLGGSKYKYLSRSVREAIDRAPVLKHRWRYIVVHNSGTRQGNAKAFDYYHRKVRKMPNGLAYHFVIGNGTSSGNGQVEIGSRWLRQINGGHVHSDYLNSIALGICLVGDFNGGKPKKEQLEALEELIRYLRNRVGKTERKYAVVRIHKDINPPQWPTDCPGNKFPVDWLYRKFD